MIKRKQPQRLVNAMTIDLEEYFHFVTIDQWSNFEPRLAGNVERVLDMLAEYNVNATFFTLGAMAERYPDLIRKITKAGHEIGSHGYEHEIVTSQTRLQFKEDVAKTKSILEDISGQCIKGYRAACFSINTNNLWALEILAEVGYLYSSSINPTINNSSVQDDVARFTFKPNEGFLEIPVTTVKFLGRLLPCSGGGYFRLLPYGYTKWGLSRVNCVEKQPGVFFFHPWEIDPDQPRIRGRSVAEQFRHYVNLGRMEYKLRRLLTDFRWHRMDEVFGIE